METQKILNYLNALSENNDREWYHTHKADYQEANAQFEKLIEKLIKHISVFDKSIADNRPSGLTFKLVRDTRFSHDKSPYNPAFRAHISSMGKLPIPVGYYIMIKPGQSFIGGGLFADMFKDATAMVRDYIVNNGTELEAIILEPEFSRYFTVKGSKLKNVPNGYDKAHPQAELLKHKSWYLEYTISDSEIKNADAFINDAVEMFHIMKPFNDYLNRALEGFKMPER